MRKFASIIVGFILSINICNAQKSISFPFGNNYDEDAQLLIGIQYNYIAQNYRLILQKNWQELPLDYAIDDIAYLGKLKSISSPTKSGLSVGIPFDYQPTSNVALNFSPSFVFMNGQKIRYTSLDENLGSIDRSQRQSLNSTTGSNFNLFEFPLNLKFKSEEKHVGKYNQGRYKGYLVGGIRLSKFIGINKDYRQLESLKVNNQIYPDNIIVKSQYISWEAGFGAEILFNNFKISPELKFNQSIGNVLDNNHNLATANKFMAPLEKAYLRNIYFSLTFQ